MPPAESPIPRQPSLRDDAIAILRKLRDAGHVAYLAGGCVRDMLLGIDAKDFDVATDAPPDRVRTLFINTQAVGAKFGVILVRQGKSVIEVATFRAEGDYEDGRRPREVRFTTAEEDAQRRDFTINGLFFDPIENRVIDFVGGQADLKAKILRAIGEPNHRFEEDHLRLLRAVRFAARFDLVIEEKTAAAISKHAEQLKRISPERIADELRMMLTPPTRTEVWRLLWKFNMLQVIFRTLPDKPREPEPGEFFEQLSPGETVSFPLALAMLVLAYRQSAPHTWSLTSLPEVKRAVQACRMTLKISNHESDSLQGILHLSEFFLENPPSVATMKRFLARPESGDATQLLRSKLRCNPAAQRVIWLLKQFAELHKSDVAPPPLVSGDDLTAQGLKPGKLFKRILDETYDAQLEGRVQDKAQALDFAMGIARLKDGPHPNPSTPRSPRQQEYRERGQEGH
jgi:poly(A) polymerase